MASSNRLAVTPTAGDPSRADWLRHIEKERALVGPVASQAPTDPERFAAWFENLEDVGPGPQDRLFDYLEESASLFEMKWFLNQEEGPEATAVGENLAVRDLLLNLAADGRYKYQCVGAVCADELMRTGRAEKVARGMQRLGMHQDASRYLASLNTYGVRLSGGRNRELLRPLVQADPSVVHAIAEGALMRLRAGARCYARYRRQFGFPEPLHLRSPLTSEFVSVAEE